MTTATHTPRPDTPWMEATHAFYPQAMEKTMPGIRRLTTPAMTRLARLRQLGTVHERSCGPLHGRYIVSRGSCVDEDGRTFIGSYKICDNPPPSFEHAKASFIGWLDHTVGTSLEAMHAAEACGKERIMQSLR